MWLLFILLSLITPKLAVAAGEFNITQNSTYTVNRQGLASVHQEVSLSNNFSGIYAKEYQINLSGADIQNITGNDSSGNIINKSDLVNGQTSIDLKFQNPAIGKDQVKTFVLLRLKLLEGVVG